MRNILVIAPHPDDETLGCGGTILKHKENGDQIFWLIMTCMTTGVGFSKEQIQARSLEIEKVAELYSVAKVFPLRFATAMLDTIPRRDLIGEVSKIFNETHPEIVYISNRSDIHSDHKITFDVVMTSIKTFRFSSIKRVLSYEVLSETEFSAPFQSNAFTPNIFSDISNYLDKKIEIMRVYKGQLGTHPFPRSEENIRAIATFRGATAGVKYAESFMLLKEIV